MIRYILTRMAWFIPNVLFLSFALFASLQLLVGSPAAMMLGLDASPEAIEAINERYGFNDPILVQYGRWLFNALQGDFGRSFSTSQEVSAMIVRALPVTVELALWSIILALVGAIVLSTITADRKIFSGPLASISVVSVTIPNFVLGTLLVLFFSIYLQWLPTSNWVFWEDGVVDHFRHLVLPIITLGAFYFGSFCMIYNAEYRAVRQQLFVRVAKAKGVTNSRVSFVHVMPNAVLPVIVYVGISLGQLVAGAVVSESMFSLPGVGRLFVDAIKANDYPVILAIGMLVLTGMIVANLVTDIVIARLNPLVRLSETA